MLKTWWQRLKLCWPDVAIYNAIMAASLTIMGASVSMFQSCLKGLKSGLRYVVNMVLAVKTMSTDTFQL